MYVIFYLFFFSSRRRHTRCALVTGVQTCALPIYVRTLNIANNPFKPGDILVTSGTGGLYPPNIPVAIVVRRPHDGALARPLAAPGKVDAMAVLRPYTPDNIDTQRRPAPAPTPAPPDAPLTGSGSTAQPREGNAGSSQVIIL